VSPPDLRLASVTIRRRINVGQQLKPAKGLDIVGTRSMKMRSQASEARILLAGTVASTFFFLVITVWISQSLTFFWDDYEVLKLIAERPVEQLFMNGAGHFGPVWRIFFMGEVYLFGPYFPPYIFTSALLGAVGFWGFAYSFRPLMSSFFWLVIPISLIFFTSLGVLTQTLIAVGSEFTLAFAFAGTAAYIYSRTLSLKWPIPLLIASGLSLNGTLPIYFSMFAAVMITFLAQGRSPLSAHKVIIFSVVGLISTVIWAGTAAILGALNPSPYYATAPAEQVVTESGSNPLLLELFEFVQTVITLLLTWVSGPLIPGAVSTPEVMSRLLFFIALYFAIFVFIALVLAVAFMLLLVRGEAHSLKSQSLVVIAWSIPIMISAGILTYTRPESLTTVRYEIIWVPATLLFYLALVLIVFPNSHRLLVRIAGVAGISLLVLSAIVGVLRAPQTVVAAADMDRPRSTLSQSQHALMSQCLSTNSITPIEEISPRLSAEDFCTVSRFLYTRTVPSLLTPENN